MAHPRPDAFDAAVGRLYASAGNGEWDRVLSEVTGWFDARVYGLAVRHTRRHDHIHSVSSNLAPEAVSTYNEYYGKLDPLAPRAAARVHQPLITSDELVSERELTTTEFFNDWMFPNSGARWLGAALVMQDDWFPAIAIIRDRFGGYA